MSTIRTKAKTQVAQSQIETHTPLSLLLMHSRINVLLKKAGNQSKVDHSKVTVQLYFTATKEGKKVMLRREGDNCLTPLSSKRERT